MAMLVRAKWLIIPMVLILIVVGYAAWHYFAKWESTDDAQVDGHIHPVNVRVGGTITSVNVQENQYVAAGAVLAQIDARDYEIAVARAAAELAQAEAGVIGARAGLPVAASTAGVQITSSEAIAERAKTGVDMSERELKA